MKPLEKFWWKKVKNSFYLLVKKGRKKQKIVYIQYEDWVQEFRNLLIKKKSWSYFDKITKTRSWYERLDVYILEETTKDFTVTNSFWDIVSWEEKRWRAIKTICVYNSECNIDYTRGWRSRL